MKQVMFKVAIILTFVFIFAGCEMYGPQGSTTIEKNHDFKTEYALNSPMPDFSQAITITDVNGNPITITEIDTSEVKMDAVGDYNIIFTYKVSETRSATYTLKIHVADSDGPVIEGLRDVIEVEVGTTAPDWLAGITVTDSDDGAIDVNEIDVDKTGFNLNVIGEYTVTYSISDSKGNNTTEELLVRVKDTTAPVINGLLTNREVELGEALPDWLYCVSVTDNYDGDIPLNRIVVQSNVNMAIPGYYSVVCSISDSSGNRTEKTVSVKVKDKPNTIYYNELTSILRNIDSSMLVASSYRLYVEKYGEVYNKPPFYDSTFYMNQNELLIDKSKFYYEDTAYNGYNFKYHDFYVNESGNVYRYRIDDVDSKFVDYGYVDKATNLKYPYSTLKFAEGFNTLATYTKTYGPLLPHYLVTSKLSYFPNNEIIQYIVSFGYNLTVNAILNLTCNFDITYDPDLNRLVVTVSVKDIPVTDQIAEKIDAKIIYTIDQFNSIEKTDIFSGDYTINPPHGINSVKETTDITKPIVCQEEADFHYYKANFEAGQYSYLFNTNSYSISFYDSLKRPITVEKMAETFILPYDGTYYFELETSNPNGYTLTFEKLNYQTYFSRSNPIVLSGSTTGRLEGVYDYEIFQYKVTQTSALVIETDPGNTIYLFKDNQFWPQYSEISLDVSASDLVIFAIRNASGTPVDYTLNAREIIDNPETPIDVAAMDAVTTEFSTQVYVVGYHFKFDCLRLDAPEAGGYMFEFMTVEGSSQTPGVNIYKVDGTYIGGYGDCFYNLEAGTYYIQLGMDIDTFRSVRVKYTFFPVTDELVSLEIGIMESPIDLTSVSFPTTVSDNLYAKGSKITYNFTLEQNMTIFFSGPINLYDSEGKLLSFEMILTYQIYGLAAGNYYFQKVNLENTPIAFTLKVGQTNSAINDDFYPYALMPSIESGTPITYKKDYGDDIEVFTLNVNANCTVSFLSSFNLFIFDSSHRFVTVVPGNSTRNISLNAGTYFIVVKDQINPKDSTGTITVTIPQVIS